MGYKAINLDFSFHNANKAPVIQDTFSIQNQLINSMKLRIRKDIDFISLPYFDEVRNKLIHFKGSKEPLTLINVKYIVNDMLYWIDIFKEILNKKKVKYVLIVNYYQSISHALIFAARELGIATIDVQHGNQVSPYYHNWSIVPGDGYNTLPNFFGLGQKIMPNL